MFCMKENGLLKTHWFEKKMVANVILNVSANCYENSEYKEYVEQYVII